MIDGYDVIGDIHGHAAKLEALLARMGYAHTAGAWRHPNRKAVFVGDLVDRGPEQVRTIMTVRSMVDAGSASMVLGNHEWNSLALYTPDGKGGHLRPRTIKNLAQVRAFTDEVGLDTPLHDEIAAWFMDIPLWLDLPGIRVVHATWDTKAMAVLKPHLRPGDRPTPELLAIASDGMGNSIGADGSRPHATSEFRAIETLLKGVEVDLPEGRFYQDADGHQRTATRTRWWDAGARDYRTAALLPRAAAAGLPADRVPDGATLGYRGTKPLFIGHYWMTGTPTILGPRVACVDYSAGKGGPLVAYRWSGETELDEGNFVTTG